jgi:hypothetical protein
VNPRTALPPNVRLYAYALLTAVALGVAAYQAAEGDWLEFAGLLAVALTGGTAASNVNEQ